MQATVKAAAMMVALAVGLGAGACTGERPPTNNEVTPPVAGGEVAKAGEAEKADAGEAAKTGDAGEVAKAGEPKSSDAREPADPTVVDPVAAADPEPSVSAPTVALPAAGDDAVPAVVFAATARSKRWSVDMTDFTGMDVAALERKLSKALETKGEDAARRVLEEGDPLLPAGLAVGDPWTIVTPKGAEHHTAEGFKALVMGGSGTLHLYVSLGAAPARHKSPAIALRGHLPLGTTLAVPEPLAKSEVTKGMRGRIDKALARPVARELKEETEELRTLVKAIPIRATDVKAYPGRFPGGRTHVVFVQTGPASADTGIAISGVLTLEADESVEFVHLASVWGSVSLLGLLDVDGDGIDEVFFEDRYHEGWSLEMIQWDGEKPRRRTLTGDGL